MHSISVWLLLGCVKISMVDIQIDKASLSARKFYLLDNWLNVPVRIRAGSSDSCVNYKGTLTFFKDNSEWICFARHFILYSIIHDKMVKCLLFCQWLQKIVFWLAGEIIECYLIYRIPKTWLSTYIFLSILLYSICGRFFKFILYFTLVQCCN